MTQTETIVFVAICIIAIVLLGAYARQKGGDDDPWS